MRFCNTNRVHIISPLLVWTNNEYINLRKQRIYKMYVCVCVLRQVCVSYVYILVHTTIQLFSEDASFSMSLIRFKAL